MKRPLLIIVLFFCAAQLTAQDYLIRQFPLQDTVEKEHGPNRKNYSALLFGFGWMGGPTDSMGSNIRPGKSFYLTYGGRFKRKRNNFIHTGSDFYLEWRRFYIDQSNKKVFADTLIHKKETFSQLTLNFSPYIRFHLGKRGDHLGKYIDIYGAIMYSFFNRQYTYDKLDANANARYIKQTQSKLKYVNPWFAQVGIRYGISFFQVQAFYRPFRMFKNSSEYPFPELPRFGLGLLFDLKDDSYK